MLEGPFVGQLAGVPDKRKSYLCLYDLAYPNAILQGESFKVLRAEAAIGYGSITRLIPRSEQRRRTLPEPI
jgi:hypothetical protein